MSSFDAKKEVTGIILFFCSLALTLIYVLSESVIGPIGVWIKNIGFGLIGISAYMIPVFLCYAAFDFFLEKRKGVSPIRIRSVILLMICFAALFSVATTDFEYFKSLCLDDISGKYKATKAIALLWKSGPDSSLIANPASTSKVLSGGIIGGSIACSLNMMIGKILAILTLIVVLLSQVILFFHISLKKTAKSAAKYINNTTNNMVKTVRVASGNAYGRPTNNPNTQVKRTVPYNPNHSPRPINNSNCSSPYVNITPDRQVANGGVLPPRDPFSKDRLPVDQKTGFVDVSAPEFGVQNTNTPNRLNYENRQVSTEGADKAPSADFTYTTMQKNPPLRASRKEVERPDFLKKEKNQSFYDLGDGFNQYEDTNYYNQENNSDYSNGNIPSTFTSDDLPEEIIDDDPYDYKESYEEENQSVINTHGTRQAPVINIIVDRDSVAASGSQSNCATPSIAGDVENNVSSYSENVVSNAIPVNANLNNNEGYDALEGRIIETNESKTVSADFSSGPSHQESSTNEISKKIKKYIAPPVSILAPEQEQKNPNNTPELQAKAIKLVETLKSFGIETKVENITHGPAITRFELTFVNPGIKVSRVLSLQDDIALAMAAFSVRIEAPIPGKSAIGIEIPNEKTSAVQLSGLIKTKEFRDSEPLAVPLGKDIPGRPIMCNLAKMPHLLIAGSTGSGKSVCINTILTSILYKSSPKDVRLILVDPKVVELSIYNGIPHLLMPVVTDPKKASNALKWAVMEMERRYKCFAESSVRDLKGYNEYLRFKGEEELPLILIVIDELADLMTVAQKEVEDQISRLAAMARAAGLHMIIATQRPSVDVITGVIKANVPSRIAFAVSSGVDSRTILDSVGAEKLLGKGDMLYAPQSAPKPVRGQGAFLSDKEVEEVVKYLKTKYGTFYDQNIIAAIESSTNNSTGGTGNGVSPASAGEGEDELLDMAVDIVIEAKNASVSILQRRLGIGYPRAARLIDVLEQKHVIGPFEGSKPRKVLITKTDWLEMKSKG